MGNLQLYAAMLIFKDFQNIHMLDMSLFKRYYQSGMLPAALFAMYNVKAIISRDEYLAYVEVEKEIMNTPGDVDDNYFNKEHISNIYKNTIINMSGCPLKHEFFLTMDISYEDIKIHSGKSVQEVQYENEIMYLNNTRRCVECGGEVDESTIGAAICDICIQEM